MVTLPHVPTSSEMAPPTVHSTLMKAAALPTRQREADAEIDQRLGGPARVVGDAVLGVGRLLAGDVEVIEALVGEPAGDQALGRSRRASAPAASRA